MHAVAQARDAPGRIDLELPRCERAHVRDREHRTSQVRQVCRRFRLLFAAPSAPMRASGMGRRPVQPEPAGRASPDPSELRAPGGSFDDAPLAAVLRAVFRSHEGRVTLHALFDDAFERLVTDGRAAEYAPLVERYRLKYAALDENEARCADRMRAISDASGCAAMVDGIRRAESARLELHAEIQVLRQRRSLAAPDDPARAELDARLASRSIGHASCPRLHAPAPCGGGPAAAPARRLARR